MEIKCDTIIGIVNWNGQHLLGECLDSLREQSYQRFEIILVDNGSVDNSINYTRKNFPEVKIIELTENTGFAKGNNIGISNALKNKKIQNVILLNNDTKVKKDFVEQLVKYQVQHKGKTSAFKIGALAPKMVLATKMTRQDLVIDAVGARVGLDGRGYSIGHGEIDSGQYHKSQEVFGFCGGAVLLKRKALEDIASQKINKQTVRQDLTVEYQEYFDDNFFAYYEDADLSCRMRLRGWSTVTVPRAIVYHLHSATADTIKSKTFRAYYLNRNRFLMMFKNFPSTILWKGLLLVPKSYFKKAKKERKHKENSDSRESVFLRKIVMIGVIIKVIGSLILNSPRIIFQRRQIKKGTLITDKDFKKWLAQ